MVLAVWTKYWWSEIRSGIPRLCSTHYMITWSWSINASIRNQWFPWQKVLVGTRTWSWWKPNLPFPFSIIFRTSFLNLDCYHLYQTRSRTHYRAELYFLSYLIISSHRYQLGFFHRLKFFVFTFTSFRLFSVLHSILSFHVHVFTLFCSRGHRLGIIAPYGVIRASNCNKTIYGWNVIFKRCTFRKSKVAPTFYMAKGIF